MKRVFTGLSTALDAGCAGFAQDDAELAEECATAQALLAELGDRVCRTVPAQGAGVSAEAIVAAIRADPAVARAAAAALAADA
ncbi:hypothetical protein [Streptomyces sp. NBC_01268]|uniref:hypothetical protein n=1 Tax=Streptomyces sp. NBC_01268 TaxID=2903806 RepID=UPI002E313B97|nr:hypothetical protein [Streptomyces sp. NBC_01268]